MQKGIYINENSEVVYTGNKKESDPVGLTWIDVDSSQWPTTTLLNLNNIYTHLWNGENIIENPIYLTLRVAEDQRLIDIETEQENAGLKNITLIQAYDYIDNQLDSASTVSEIKEVVRNIFKK